jgi:hypothetical protein
VQPLGLGVKWATGVDVAVRLTGPSESSSRQAGRRRTAVELYTKAGRVHEIR